MVGGIDLEKAILPPKAWKTLRYFPLLISHYFCQRVPLISPLFACASVLHPALPRPLFPATEQRKKDKRPIDDAVSYEENVGVFYPSLPQPLFPDTEQRAKEKCHIVDAVSYQENDGIFYPSFPRPLFPATEQSKKDKRHIGDAVSY